MKALPYEDNHNFGRKKSTLEMSLPSSDQDLGTLNHSTISKYTKC